MAAGATQAPATARAISFLFIKISFVEMRPLLREEPHGEIFFSPRSGNFPEFFEKPLA
jgi:hypothetical protein